MAGHGDPKLRRQWLDMVMLNLDICICMVWQRVLSPRSLYVRFSIQNSCVPHGAMSMVLWAEKLKTQPGLWKRADAPKKVDMPHLLTSLQDLVQRVQLIFFFMFSLFSFLWFASSKMELRSKICPPFLHENNHSSSVPLSKGYAKNKLWQHSNVHPLYFQLVLAAKLQCTCGMHDFTCQLRN